MRHACSQRPASAGHVPPPCERTNLSRGISCSTPPKISAAAATVVPVGLPIRFAMKWACSRPRRPVTLLECTSALTSSCGQPPPAPPAARWPSPRSGPDDGQLAVFVASFRRRAASAAGYASPGATDAARRWSACPCPGRGRPCGTCCRAR